MHKDELALRLLAILTTNWGAVIAAITYQGDR